MSALSIPTLELNKGVLMPVVGLGVYQVPPGRRTRETVRSALELGYRHVDTARIYGNERDVADGIRESGIPRREVFVTTKLWNSDHGYDAALRAFDESVKRLGGDPPDLYLIHFPVQRVRADSWRALTRLYEDRRIRAIGVSNYTVRHLEELLVSSPVVPVVNQVELHPFLVQSSLRAFCRKRGILVEAYSPLVKGERMEHPTLKRIAAAHGRTPAQVLIRFCIQHGLVAIPKSVRPERMAENASVFDFALSREDMTELDQLDEDYRTDWDPTSVP